MTHGLFEVIGSRQYRGHPTGTRFESKIDAATNRACARQDIRLVEVIEPKLVAGSFTLPNDWPPQTADAARQSGEPEGSSLVRGGGK